MLEDMFKPSKSRSGREGKTGRRSRRQKGGEIKKKGWKEKLWQKCGNSGVEMRQWDTKRGWIENYTKRDGD